MAVSKKRGIKSSAQDNFLQPDNVTSLSGTNVGTSRPYLATANTTSAASAAGTGGSVSLTWTLPAGSPAATGYTITTTPSTYTVNTGSSTPSYTFQGLASNTSYTFTVQGTNASGTASGTTSSSVTVTTVPATPEAPTITSVSQTATDIVTWVAPATGGSAITGYTWASNDSKTGTVSGSTLSANVAQEAGTAQAYTVYATNANGNSSTSAASASFTSFSFTPFSFAPYSFTPYSFTPYSFTPVYSFTPYAFTPSFGFWPYSFGFSVWGDSLAVQTKVLTPSGTKFIEDLVVGDTVYAMNLGGNETTNWTEWSSTDIQLDNDLVVETTVMSVTPGTAENFIHINGNLYTPAHYLLVKKDGITKFLQAPNIDTTYEVYNYEQQSWVPITTVEEVAVEMEKISINCEPYDNFFTENMLVFDRPDY
jgi:hypothetical protein